MSVSDAIKYEDVFLSGQQNFEAEMHSAYGYDETNEK